MSSIRGNDRKIWYTVAISILIVSVVVLAGIAVNYGGIAAKYRRLADAQNSKVFYEISEELDEISSRLTLAAVIRSERARIKLLDEVQMHADKAECCMNSLADSYERNGGINTFFAELKGRLEQSMAEGKTNENEIIKLRAAVDRVRENLSDQQRMLAGSNPIYQENYDFFGDGMQTDVSVDQDEPEITVEEGEERIRSFMDGITQVTVAGELTANGIFAYCYNVTVDGGVYYVQLTGSGKPLLINGYCNGAERNFVRNDAEQTAEEFVKKLGFSDMSVSDYSEDGAVAVVSLSASVGNVMIYPETVVVKVCLESGKVFGFDGGAMYNNHRARDVGNVEISTEKIAAHLFEKLDMIQERMVIKAIDGKEMLLVEVTAQYNGDAFRIYVDPKTGEEVRAEIIK